MDLLPNELLEHIFSHLDMLELPKMQRVCIRWQILINECVWRRKTTISHRDLGLYSSLETKVNRLMFFLQNLPVIDYYYFPTLLEDWNGIWYEGFTKATSECLMRVFSLLTDLYCEGRIPVHLAVVAILENMINAEEMKIVFNYKAWCKIFASPKLFFSRYSISKCQSMIIQEWPTVFLGGGRCSKWLKVTHRMAPLKEVVIENLLVSHLTISRANVNVLRNGDSSFPRIRILSVSCNYQIEASVQLGDKGLMFTFDEFVQCLKTLKRYRKHRGYCEMHWIVALLQSRGRISDVMVGSSLRLDVNDVICCLQPEADCPLASYMFLRQLFHLKPNHIGVDVHVSPESASNELDFLRHELFRHVTRLTLSIERSVETHDTRAVSLCDWNCLLQEDILARLEFLYISLPNCRNVASFMLSVPVKTLLLPRLESFELHGPVSGPHLCSLLNGATCLRNLNLNIDAMNGSVSLQKHNAFKEMLLASISQMQNLTTLQIFISGPHNRQRKWLTPWITYEVTTPPDVASQPSVRIHLKEEVFEALSTLVHLELFALRFWDMSNSFPNFSIDTSAYMHDMQHIASMLPQLRVIILSDAVFEEQERPPVNAFERAHVDSTIPSASSRFCSIC